jgi:acetyl-CoA synthetase
VVHNCLDRHRGTSIEEKVAIVWEGEAGAVRRLSYRELDDLVARFAGGLSELGVGVGDRVGIFMPQVPETVVGLLACARLGAVAVPIFSGYGPEAVAERLNGCEAQVLLCADGFSRRGRSVVMKEVADVAVARCPTVRHVVVHEHAGLDVSWDAARDRTWASLLSAGVVAESAAMDPESPLLLVYTSGTTGRPKGAVHVHGGFPVKSLADMVYGFDVQAEDVVFWFTDVGWIMAPWLAFGTLTLGATMVLYEGAPDTPDAARLWRLAADHDISVFGLSPTLVRSLQRAGLTEEDVPSLPRLRVLGSTGEMWDPVSWAWLFETVGRRRVPIVNYSGGTELSGGIVGGNLLTPLRPMAMAGPLPGMHADVVDERGESVRGIPGELVLRGPSPGMTWGFWGDDERYVETYWSRLPGIWVHGDRCCIDEADGLWYVLGRSDDTIKIAGKRLGPGEVEAILGRHAAVATCAALGAPDPLKGETLVCLVVPSSAAAADTKTLEDELAELVVAALGKTFRPRLVAVVPDLPRTRNGKIVRRVARAALTGQHPGDTSALENPEALTALAELGAQRGLRLAPPGDKRETS